MKKIITLGIIASAVLTMTNCSTDEVNDMAMTSQSQAIGFSTYLGNSAKTRGSVTTTDGIKDANTGFGVFATYTGTADFGTDNKQWEPNFMYNQQVTYSNNSWSYSPVKYWPTTSGEKISFFAYAPYQSSSDNGIVFPTLGSMKGLPSATITLQAPEKMIDFVATSVMNQEKPTGDNANTVNFVLRHEMTKVGIEALTSGMDKNTKIVITKVTLSNTTATDGTKGLYKTAIYKFPDSNSSGNTTSVGTWDYTNSGTNGSAVTYDSALDLDGILSKGTTSYTSTLGGSASTGVEVTGGNEKAVSIFKKISDEGKDTHSLFLIPANGSTGLSESSVYVNVEYFTVTPLTSSSNETTNVVMKHTKSVALPSGTLKQGYAYTYTLTFNMDVVKLHVTRVEEWSEASNYTGTINM